MINNGGRKETINGSEVKLVLFDGNVWQGTTNTKEGEQWWCWSIDGVFKGTPVMPFEDAGMNIDSKFL